MGREPKTRRYFERIADALHKHGVTEKRLNWEDPHPDAKAIRLVTSAFMEPAIAWDPEMERALKRVVERIEEDPEFAKMFYTTARKYRRKIPRGWPPEAKVSQISSLPIGRIHPDEIPQKPPRTRDGLLKYMLIRDVQALTRMANNVKNEATSPRSRRRP